MGGCGVAATAAAAASLSSPRRRRSDATYVPLLVVAAPPPGSDVTCSPFICVADPPPASTRHMCGGDVCGGRGEGAFEEARLESDDAPGFVVGIVAAPPLERRRDWDGICERADGGRATARRSDPVPLCLRLCSGRRRDGVCAVVVGVPAEWRRPRAAASSDHDDDRSRRGGFQLMPASRRLLGAGNVDERAVSLRRRRESRPFVLKRAAASGDDAMLSV